MSILPCQKDQFDIEDHIHYLNCAYMSPLMKKVEEAGHRAVALKARPYQIKPVDFFSHTNHLKATFAQLIHAEHPDRIALIPSASYGIATVANNLRLKPGDNIVMLEEQFPSNYYIWERICKEQQGHIKIVAAPDSENRSEAWNEAILAAIDEKTALVAMSHVHWADGTWFDLEAIRAKSKQHDALLVIDGTQSVGALPFDIKKIQPDALICAAYKWLMGPYSIGYAYYGSYFDHGTPIEENWINRLHSQDFQHLVNYQKDYQPMAWRYSVGEQSNFILVPMAQAALEQLLKWGQENIQQYCRVTGRKKFSANSRPRNKAGSR